VPAAPPEASHTPAPRPRVSPQRRRRLTGRLFPAAAIAIAAFVVGLIVGANHEPRERVLAKRFVAAWTRGDYGGMYQLLSQSSQDQFPAAQFTRLYKDAAETATLEHVQQAAPMRTSGGTYEVPMRAVTRTFGTLNGTLRFQVVTEGNDLSGVSFARQMVFPGLGAGQTLHRTVVMPPRAELEARDGRVLATGSDRTSPVGPLAAEVVGHMGPIPAEDAARYAKLGYPPDAAVGISGLERQFETRLAGSFGGTLRAGPRLLASAEPKEGDSVRTSIDLDLESAAVTALAGRLGGIAVLRPKTGEVLALAGIGYSAPQPPGSTFKIITLSAALDAGIAKPTDTFAVQTSALLSGVELQNANGEACGGSLAASFAESCNSVFGPLGAKLGATRLVAAAERFGFNRDDGIAGAPAGAIPPPGEIGDDLAVGSSAIGQGRVTSTPLRMAEVGGVIANKGVLVRPTLLRGDQGARSRATTKKTAKFVNLAMRGVVAGGTGYLAALPGVTVAGKTGTAELRSTVPDPNATPDPNAPPEDPNADTDAWFVCFAPAKKPKIVVAVLLVGAGAGGATAAPAARTVLDAAF
jgi:beta-lactamase class D